jgi:sugar phosphate isomerase/epimerase
MITNRRTILTGGAALATLATTGALFGRADAAQVGKVGLQLYTVRTLFQADPVATLEQIAKIGYREVEYGGGGYTDMDAAMLRKATDRLGLTAPSAHIPYDLLLNRFDASLAMAKTLGVDTVVLPYMTDQYRNEAAWKEAVANFNRIGEKLKKAGLGFVYHNHDFEFTVKPGGVSLYDRLVKERDPALVGFELDLYWAIRAGENIEALVRRLSGHIYSYHVKDMRKDGSMTAVGAGTVDFAAIFALNKVAGVKHFFVENDEAPAPYIPDITTSYQNLRKLRFNG